MKKAVILIMMASCLILSACSNAASIGIIGGADGPTAIYIGDDDTETKKTDSGWGITLWTEDVTPNGLSLCIEQSGGNATGELQTGAPYILEIWEEDKWISVEYKDTEEVPVWNAMAYMIPKNEITKMSLNFEFIYNELKAGRYRVGKEIMDFRKPGDYDSRIYYAEFVIE